MSTKCRIFGLALAWAIALPCGFGLAPAASAKEGISVDDPVKEVTTSTPAAQPGGTYRAPKGNATLIYSVKASAGDFPEATVLVKQGSHVYELGAFRNIAKVVWSKDGRSVSFEGTKLISFGLDDISLVTFKLGQHTLRRKVLRQAKDEPSG